MREFGEVIEEIGMLIDNGVLWEQWKYCREN